MTRRRRFLGRLNLGVSALVALAIWVAATVLATRPGFKALIDVTPQAHFSVSAETRQLLDELRAADLELRIDTFYQPLPPGGRTPQEQHLIGIQQRIQSLTTDLLRRYAELGGDRVRVRHYDVLREVTPARTRIEELGGLVYQNSVVVALGKRHKELSLSLDLAQIDNPAARQTAAPGQRMALPRLEYYKGEEAISSAIRSLLAEGTPVVYFLQGYDSAELTAAVGNSYSELLTALEGDGFRIGRWHLGEGPVPDDADIVALVEPRNEMPAADAEKLFEFLQRGGRVFLNVAFSPLGRHVNPTFDHLGERLGFELGTEMVCEPVPDPRAPDLPGVGGPGAQNLRITAMAPHPITAPLRRSGTYPLLKLAREIRTVAPPAGTRINADDNLLRTGPWAWLATANPATAEVDFGLPDSREAFASRSVGAVFDVHGGEGRPGHLVIVSGIAFLNEGFKVNGDLALNVFNWMAQRSELVTVRGQRYRSLRIEVGPVPAKRSARLLRLWVPGALLAAALVVWFVRSRN